MDIESVTHAVVMKVGYHTDEELADIIVRKKAEDARGAFFWGYGGTVCHPLRQVAPFAREASIAGCRVHLLMSFTPSRHAATRRIAIDYSCDGREWMPLPPYALVTGSRFALVCRSLTAVSAEMHLDSYVVAVGPCHGRPASDYLRHRVDKACVERAPLGADQRESTTRIQVQYAAELVPPYAVLLRYANDHGHQQRQLRL